MKRRKFIAVAAGTSASVVTARVSNSNTLVGKFINSIEGGNTMYEWKFNPRPYSDDEAKKILAPVIDAETTDWHYNTHHKGYRPL